MRASARQNALSPSTAATGRPTRSRCRALSFATSSWALCAEPRRRGGGDGVVATLNGDDDDDVYDEDGSADGEDSVMPRSKLREYNGRFCLLTCGRRLRIADLSKAVVHNDLKDSAAFYELMAPDVMRRVLRNGRTARVEMARAWMRHPRRRQADGLAFAPGEATPVFERGGRRYLNTWSGFRVRSVPPPSPARPVGPAPPTCERLLRLVREGICGGESDEFSYVMRWCALAVQHPERKVETALVLVGEPGCGKGTFARVRAPVRGREGPGLGVRPRL